MERVPRLALALALTLALPPAAWAAPDAPDATTVAKGHFELGQGLYHLGDYAGSIREFKAGYAAVPRPEFLLNLGQSYRALHELGEARAWYRLFLDQAPPGDDRRPAVEKLVASIERQMAESPPAAPRAGEPSAVKPPPAAPAVTAARTDGASRRSDGKEARPWYRRPLVWILAVAGVLVLGGAALAIALTVPARAPQPSDGTIVVSP
jgi:hypothetical protein